MTEEGFRPPPLVLPAASPAPRAASTGLKVLGIAQCGFGALGVISIPLSLASRFLARDPGSQRIQRIMWEGAFGVWMYTSIFLGLVLTLVLLGAGVGVLKGKAWGRTLSLAHGLGSLAMLIVGQVLSIVMLYPVLAEMMDSSVVTERAAAIGGIVGGVFGSLFGLVLPVIEIVVMTRPRVREWFGAGG